MRRAAAELELKSSMPGWILNADVPRLERAISEASKFDIDVSKAKQALAAEKERLLDKELASLSLGQMAVGRELIVVTVEDWPPESRRLGITMCNTTEGPGSDSQTGPPIIRALIPGSIAHKTGALLVGDLVVAINGVQVFDHVEAAKRIGAVESSLKVTILRGGPQPQIAKDALNVSQVQPQLYPSPELDADIDPPPLMGVPVE